MPWYFYEKWGITSTSQSEFQGISDFMTKIEAEGLIVELLFSLQNREPWLNSLSVCHFPLQIYSTLKYFNNKFW